MNFSKEQCDAVVNHFGNARVERMLPVCDPVLIGDVFKKLGKGNVAAMNRQKVLYYWLEDFMDKSLQSILEKAEWEEVIECDHSDYHPNIAHINNIILVLKDSPVKELMEFLFNLIK